MSLELEQRCSESLFVDLVDETKSSDRSEVLPYQLDSLDSLVSVLAVNGLPMRFCVCHVFQFLKCDLDTMPRLHARSRVYSHSRELFEHP